MSKKLVTGIVVVFMITLGVIWQLGTKPDKTVKSIVQATASDVLKTPVIISSMSIDIKQGKADISGLTVDNPEGYNKEYAFQINSITVDLDTNFVHEGLLVIKSLQIENPWISFEGNVPGDSNMHLLLDNLKSASAGNGSTPYDKDLKIIIEKLKVNRGVIQANAPETPDRIVKVKLPDFEISGIGRSQNGISINEATSIIAGELINAVVRTALKQAVYQRLKGDNKQFLDVLLKDSKVEE